MRGLELGATLAALTLAGTAHAQSGTPPPAAPPPVSMSSPLEFRGPDERSRDFERMNDDVAGRRAGLPRSSTPVHIVPEDVKVGSEVRDSRGVVLGTIEKVGMDYGVIVSPLGKIEIEFASLAKNNKGLLINMTKAKFDAMLSGGKPH